MLWMTVATARVGASEFVLARRDDDWVVRVDQRVLMSNRVHESETLLAERALEDVDEARNVLVGGLGLGYTLRAVLDLVSDDAHVVVVELVAELVDWNRRLVHELNDRPLEDPRCEVVIGDVLDVIHASPGKFDVIVLDVDNGPEALSTATNKRLYTDAGVRACRRALAPHGTLAVWSAGPHAKYAARLGRLGFNVEVQRVPARAGSRPSHVLFLATI